MRSADATPSSTLRINVAPLLTWTGVVWGLANSRSKCRANAATTSGDSVSTTVSSQAPEKEFGVKLYPFTGLLTG